ncbi:outer membrane protein assembly factor BamA, partial [Candidatus Puniceispirillum sp.]|nr:outer membrane protein assembly factor BamA [Candidatus Puniceispirillum sp.]
MRSNGLLSFVFSSLVIILVAHSSAAQLADDQVRISEIRVDGNSRVAQGTVKNYLPVRVGGLTSPGALSNALERLYETNLFQDIKLNLEGTVLVVSVIENPIINRVNIEGNDTISDERLLDVINVQQRGVYSRKVAIDATRQLIEVYRAGGRFAAVVEPKIIELDNNRVDLVFEVNEGPLIKIDSISFSGNASFSDRELKQAIASREKRWWAFLSANDKYDEGRLDYDIRLLRQFYLARGYADIQVQRARGGLLPDRSGFAITFLVNEGVRYQVNEVSIFSEIEGVDINELRKLVSFDEDAWYDVRLLEQGLLDISKKLGFFGYAFVNVTPDIKTNADTAKLNIDIKIEKSRRNFVERIEFVDNSRTTDKVIRRQFEIVEGDAYNQLKIDRSIRNIRNLGYFSEVKVQTLRGSTPEQSVTSVTVREQPTGDFSIGVGYSSLNQANFTLGINERNFLGTGRRLKMAFSTSGEDTDFTI